MGTLNHPQTSHVVMPMNSEARDLGVLNKHMLSTTIRFFKSNIIFYMIWLIQNTSIAPISAQLLGVQVDWHPGWPLQLILKGNLTTVFWIFWHHLQKCGYIEPSTDLSLGHAHEQWGKGLGDPNKHMRSTNIRLFISNSIFYMIRFIQNTISVIAWQSV